MNDPSQSLDEVDVFVEASKKGQQPRVQREICVTGFVNEVIGGQNDGADEHVAVDEVLVDQDHRLFQLLLGVQYLVHLTAALQVIFHQLRQKKTIIKI